MEEEKLGFFGRLKAGLAKTRNNIVRGIDNVFSGFSQTFSVPQLRILCLALYPIF